MFLALGATVLFKFIILDILIGIWRLMRKRAWNLLHGSQYAAWPELLISVIMPLYCVSFPALFALIQHPLTLVFCSITAHSVTALLIYQFSAETLTIIKAALFLLLSYLIWPASLFAIIYEFNFETLAPVFFTVMFIAMQKTSFAYSWRLPFLLYNKRKLALVVSFSDCTDCFLKKINLSGELFLSFWD